MNTQDDDNETEYYRVLDQLFSTIINVLKHFSKSSIITEYFFQFFTSYAYSSLISNFFMNLNDATASEFQFNSKQISKAMKQYSKTENEVNIALHEFTNSIKIDDNYYQKFKEDLKNEFPELMPVLLHLEKLVPLKRLKKYLDIKKKALRNLDISNGNYGTLLITKVLELVIQRNNNVALNDVLLGNITNNSEIMKDAVKQIKCCYQSMVK